MYITPQFLQKSPTRAVQEVREYLSHSSNPIKEANQIVFDLTTFNSPFSSNEEAAIMYAQYVVEGTIKKRADITGFAKHQIDHLLQTHPEMFKQHTSYAQSLKLTTTKVVHNVDVVVKDNGKLKKGEKQKVAEQMYQTLVIEGSMKNTEFVNRLQQDLGMTLFGARTYASNMKKKLGGGK